MGLPSFNNVYDYWRCCSATAAAWRVKQRNAQREDEQQQQKKKQQKKYENKKDCHTKRSRRS